MALDPRLYISQVSNLPLLKVGTSPDLVTLRESIARELTEIRRAIAGNVDIGVVGPATSTDNAIARWDGTTGTATQDSLVAIDDNGRINFPAASNKQNFGTAVTDAAAGVGFHFKDTVARLLGDHLTIEASTGTVIYRLRSGGNKAVIWGTGGSNYVQCDWTGVLFGVNATGGGTPLFRMTRAIPVSGTPGIESAATQGFAIAGNAGANGVLYFPDSGTDILQFLIAGLTIGGGINVLSQLYTADTSAGFYVTLAFTSSVALTADRTLTIDLVNAARTFKLGGNAAFPSGSAYTPTNVTTDRAYDANATTLDEIADVLGTLIADLKTAGVIT